MRQAERTIHEYFQENPDASVKACAEVTGIPTHNIRYYIKKAEKAPHMFSKSIVSTKTEKRTTCPNCQKIMIIFKYTIEDNEKETLTHNYAKCDFCNAKCMFTTTKEKE